MFSKFPTCHEKAVVSMNKNPDRTDPDLQKEAERLGAWLKLVGVLFRLMIVLGLLLMLLVISALLFTSLFSFWILVLPVSLMALGIILAWLEFQLHNRYYALLSRDMVHEDEQKQG